MDGCLILVWFKGTKRIELLLLYALSQCFSISVKLFQMLFTDIPLSKQDLVYMDDCAVFKQALLWAHLEQSPQSRLKQIEVWSIANRVLLHPGKCKAFMHEEVEYLGITFNSRTASSEPFSFHWTPMLSIWPRKSGAEETWCIAFGHQVIKGLSKSWSQFVKVGSLKSCSISYRFLCTSLVTKRTYFREATAMQAFLEMDLCLALL